jgi:beta-glucuronidase
MQLGKRIMSCFIAVTMLLAGAAATKAQSPADYTGPDRIDLSGVWGFRLDPANDGEGSRWFAPETQEKWMEVRVPGSFNEELATHANTPTRSDTMRFYEGKVWYRTTFASPALTGKMDCFLHLSGTVLRQKVWLNGQALGGSVVPYLDVSYDVSKLLKSSGVNLLVVEVDNSIEERAIPDRNWRGWWDDGGLIRPVYLEMRPEVHSQSYVTTTMLPDGRWKLAIDTTVYQAAASRGASVAYDLTDGTGRLVWHRVSRGAVGDVHVSGLFRGVKTWSPEHPSLYRLTTTTTNNRQSDIVRIRIGFRQIEVKGTQILLNGEPLKFRGITRHQFLAGVGMSLTVAEDRKDIEDIKALGANFVRLAHYTQSQDVFDACDELGLLVWTEIPAWQTGAATLADPHVWTDYAKPQLRSMVMQHRNHPSVVIWSVANEIPTDQVEGKAYVEKAIAYVKTLDTSRLVTFASDKREKDIALAAADIIAVNEYFGWYYGRMEDVGSMLDNLHRLHPNQPILVSEFGSEAIAGWERASAAPGSKDYSYDYQARLLKAHLTQIFSPERQSFMAGGVLWLYNDFPDPHHFGEDQPIAGEYRNSKGLVTMDRVRKPSYGVVKDFFATLGSSATNE